LEIKVSLFFATVSVFRPVAWWSGSKHWRRRRWWRSDFRRRNVAGSLMTFFGWFMVLFVMLICGIRPPIALLLAILTKKLIRILILILFRIINEVFFLLIRSGCQSVVVTYWYGMIFYISSSVLISVADPNPDPRVFGPPGSGSTSQRYG
jgi:hypothetical protein